MLRWVTEPRYETVYLVASHCPDDIFDALTGYDVRVWHLAVPIDEDTPDFMGEASVPGAHFTVGRAWPIAAIMGHCDLHFYGFDCSFPEDCTSHHAYGYEWTREEPVAVTYLGKRFVTTPGLLGQIDEFVKMRTMADGKFKIVVHGDSLAAAVCGVK